MWKQGLDYSYEQRNKVEHIMVQKPEQNATLEKIIEKLRACYDPEIPVNIYDLGLIYRINLEADGAVAIDMTLTAPGCPVAGTLPKEVELKVAEVEGVAGAKVRVVWDPPWSPDLLSDEARLELGML